MKKQYLAFALLMGLTLSACGGKNDVSDIIEDVEPAIETTVMEEITVQGLEGDEALGLEENSTGNSNDEGEMGFVFVDVYGDEVKDLEGWWSPTDVFYDESEEEYQEQCSAVILDNHISMEFSLEERYWAGTFEKVSSEGGKTKYISKRISFENENREVERSGDEMEFILEDSKLSYIDEEGRTVSLGLMTRTMVSTKDELDQNTRLFIEYGFEGDEDAYDAVDIENLQYSCERSDDGNLFVTITNTSDTTFGCVTVELEEFDDSYFLAPGFYIDGVNSYSICDFKPNQSVKVKLTNTREIKNLCADVYFTQAEGINTVYPNLFKTSSADIALTSARVGDDIEISFTNNRDKDIEYVEYNVVYYKDGKIVDYGDRQEELSLDKIDEISGLEASELSDHTKNQGQKVNHSISDEIPAGETIKMMFSTPDIEYDDYKIYMIHAVVKQ